MLYDRFKASVSRYDCGNILRSAEQRRAGLAAPPATPFRLMDKTEFKLLQTRSDLWHKFKIHQCRRPGLALGHAQILQWRAECKGPAHCERDNRSFACRAFPFYPYLTREDKVVGLATYWTFERPLLADVQHAGGRGGLHQGVHYRL